MLCRLHQTRMLCKYRCLERNKFHCFDMAKRIPLSKGSARDADLCVLMSKNIRVVQVAPDHDEVQVHVFGPVQVPPF